jgi:hypothetical protein
VAVREGPLNLVAFGWMAVAVLLAAPWLPALRALARRTVSVSAARA